MNESKIRPGTVGHREERALFTAAVIAISTIVGSLAVGGVALATESIAKCEANRVMQTEANARGIQNERNIHNFMMINNKTLEVAKQLDKHEYLNALNARSNNNYFFIYSNYRYCFFRNCVSFYKNRIKNHFTFFYGSHSIFFTIKKSLVFGTEFSNKSLKNRS